MPIIGREKEIETLNYCFESDKSEFVVVYGRRRIGKTFLIKELFEEKFCFYSTGILNGDKNTQLLTWNNEIFRFGGMHIPVANNWIEAFDNLNTLIEERYNDKSNKKVIFLDEVPWMATMHSDFLAGLDYFWNRWASSRKDILLIICGSAASWITDKIINNRGGLHNRLTRRIFIAPFNLNECEKYCKAHNIIMTRYQIAEFYMIFGGVPYYLSLMNPKFSLYQNVDEMYFSQNAELQNEFENLFRSLYIDADNYIKVIEALATKGIGLTRYDISENSGVSDGGSLTKILNNLSTSGFIREYKSYGKKKKDSLYQLTDFFTIFDIRFRNERKNYSDDFWLQFSSTPLHANWRGICYEKLCLMHLSQIRKKLGISGILTAAYSWRGKADDSGVQVDLVIDRNDNVINLCEVKFSTKPYTLEKSDSEALRNKRAAFMDSTRTHKAVITTMITTFGLNRNMYSSEIISEVVLDDLFE